jgi:DNA modification methylase
MDCLEGIKQLKDQSVDLIIADPPYYKTINEAWDKQWKTESEYLNWCKLWINECARVLKNTGSFYIYGNYDILSKQKVLILDNLLYFRQAICLNKGLKSIAGRTSDKLRMFPTATEYVLFFVKQNEDAYYEDDICFKNLRKYFLDALHKSGYNRTSLNQKLGHRKAEHTFYTKKQWAIPTKEVYSELQTIMNLNRSYDDIKYEYDSNRFTFNLPFATTDVWDFTPDKIRYGHKTQKPMEITQRIINASSNINDLILIPFVGSGSECVGAKLLQRNFIGFEISQQYIDIANQRISMLK